MHLLDYLVLQAGRQLCAVLVAQKEYYQLCQIVEVMTTVLMVEVFNLYAASWATSSYWCIFQFSLMMYLTIKRTILAKWVIPDVIWRIDIKLTEQWCIKLQL